VIDWLVAVVDAVLYESADFITVRDCIAIEFRGSTGGSPWPADDGELIIWLWPRQ